MFASPSEYPFLTDLTKNVGLIHQELSQALQNNSVVRDALLSTMALDYPSNQWTWDNAINTASVGYDLRDGNYTMLTLFKEGHNLDNIRKAFPETSRLLNKVEGLTYACISALSPGTHLKLHSHSRSQYIFHLLLNDLTGNGCEIICNGHRRQLTKQGDTVLFDYSLPHETYSHSKNIRFNLMVDFLPKEKISL